MSQKKKFAGKGFEKNKKIFLNRNKLDYKLYESAILANKQFKRKQPYFYIIAAYMKMRKNLQYFHKKPGLPSNLKIFDATKMTYVMSGKLKEKSRLYSRFISFIKG